MNEIPILNATGCVQIMLDFILSQADVTRQKKTRKTTMCHKCS